MSSEVPARVLICGDRNWRRRWIIKDYIDTLPSGTVVINGAARGADSVARYFAIQLGFKVEVYPAQWDKYGKAAGVIRNQQMLDDGRPDLVVYFHDNIAESKGTGDMVKRARKAGIPVERGGITSPAP